MYTALDDARRARFVSYLTQFLSEKQLRGEDGLVLDDEMRVTIAGTAVRLVLELGIERLRHVHEIIVYPSTVAVGERVVAGRVEQRGQRLTVQLGWAQVLEGLQDPHDGFDVLVHELAHVIDHEGGTFDGTPRLHATQDYGLWSQVLHHNFLEHFAGNEAQRSVLRDYAQVNIAEFFAVATEAFFERPRALEHALPDLYFKLRRFYGFDPSSQEP